MSCRSVGLRWGRFHSAGSGGRRYRRELASDAVPLTHGAERGTDGHMKAALPAALADGAGGDAGRRAVAELAARVPGRDVGAWGAGVAELLAGDPEVARAVVAAMEAHAPGSGVGWYGGDHIDFRGGVFPGEVVGAQVVVQQAAGAAAAPEAMASPPPRPGGFTGRGVETKKPLRALDPADVPRTRGSAAVLVAAVSGLGGIGKTALAVETAHPAQGKDWFPGGPAHPPRRCLHPRQRTGHGRRSSRPS
ncbi:hypothetical protein STRIP9103_06841 [Streptomyces ipomoeae 91-03]|uniref:Uncharacterized protein n=1 Tax=Streptomyces ipomoeae 91-03 TaxID=698759 RepID=L1KZG0_9ACTN|nr:hypothetical protein STRIP9103_06841 [Streptomyces ipomoeae 91-03]